MQASENKLLSLREEFDIMIFDIGAGEMLVIFLIILILFGADRIPQLARGLGKGIRDFKRVVNGYQNEIQRIVEYEEQNPPPRAMPPPKVEDKKPENKTAEDSKSEDSNVEDKKTEDSKE